MKEITDPRLINQLDNPGTPELVEETDPGVLAQLNQSKQPTQIEQPENHSLWQKAKDLYTGETRREFDYPEIPNLVWNQPDKQPTFGNYEGYWPAHDSMAMAGGNPLSQADIYETNVPGSKVKFDNFGNPYATYYGKPYYLNRPGLSRADIAQAIPEALMFAGGAKIGGNLGKKAMGRFGQVVGTGIGTYGTAVGEDLTARELGSKQPVDQERAALIGSLGLAGEFAAPYIGRAYNYLKQIFRNKKFVANGTLTQEGRKALESAGMKPEAVTKEWMAEFNKLVRNELDPESAIRVASARTLPNPVKLTEGQATGNLGVQGREQARLHGVYGEEAQNVMRNQLDDQVRALGENVNTFKTGIGGGQVASKGEGVNRAVSALKNKAEATKEAIRSRYQSAKQTNAFVPIQAVKDFSQQARRSLSDEGFDLAGARIAARLKDVDKFIGQKNISAANLRGMELWRKRIVKDIDSVKMSDPSQAEALRILKRNYDDFIKDSFENALIRGDQSAITKWQNARGLRATYGEIFERNRIIDKLVKGEHTPEETVNILFGAGRFGAKSKGEVVQALDTIRKQVGPNAWNALREDAFLRLLRNQGDTFNPVKFSNEFADAMRNGGTLMRKMFSPQELQLMGQINNVAKATIYNPTAVNPSRTSYALARIANDMFGPTGRATGAIIQRFVRPFQESMEAGAARQAPFVMKVPELAPGRVGGAAAFGGSQAYRELADLLNGKE
ncbi:MAG: hypothetical protein ABW088_12515 [Sedimenticola sp.]